MVIKFTAPAVAMQQEEWRGECLRFQVAGIRSEDEGQRIKDEGKRMKEERGMSEPPDFI
jgi:hypothetical protein